MYGSSAGQCGAISDAEKTDKTDAKGIAHILRTGWFSPVHMKSREAHGARVAEHQKGIAQEDY